MLGGWGKGIHAVLCVNRGGYIGNNNSLMYSFQRDIQHFRELTTGGAVVMGRITYDSLLQRPLSRRLNIVLSESQSSGVRSGALYCQTVSDVLDEFGRSPFRNLFVIGGVKTFHAFLPFMDSLDLTMVEDDTVGDTRLDLEAILSMFRDEPSLAIDLGEQQDRNSGKPYRLSIRRYIRTDARKLY